MTILIGCETSGTIRRLLRDVGHDAWSCDLLDSEDQSPHHIVGDVFQVLASRRWDMLIAHPPCTYLCVSGLHWNKRRPERAAQTEEALSFFRRLWEADVPRIALENPIGCVSTRIAKPTQIIQPYQFGDDASKATCLWLKGLPPLKPTSRCPGRQVLWHGKQVERWSNQTDSGQNRLGPSADRWKERSRTYPGMARAMAEQWTNSL